MGKQEMGLEMLVKSSLSVSAPSFCFLPSHLVGLRIELRASCMQGKCSTTELHNPHPWFSKGFYRFPPTLQCCLGYQDQQWDIKKKNWKCNVQVNSMTHLNSANDRHLCSSRTLMSWDCRASALQVESMEELSATKQILTPPETGFSNRTPG